MITEQRQRGILLDTAISRFYSRAGSVQAVETLAPGILDVSIRATPPPGGWKTEHEIELRRDLPAPLLIEAPEESLKRLRAWEPAIEFVAAARTPGESLRSPLVEHHDHRVADSFLLAGHAQTIQHFRIALLESGWADRRVIATRVHWATGKSGL